MEDGRTPRRTELAGIPVWWADAPGEFFCSLMFRAGLADETLATCGITHLVEHLSLFALGRRSHPFNGFVDDARCVFYASGERDEVLEFVRLAAAAVHDLPLDRLETERRVLRAEASGAGGLFQRLRGHRYGAAGYGLVNYQELGLRWLGPEEITGWAAERFTRGNAVLWMTGEPPEDFALDLPDGPRLPTPEPEPLALQHPAFLAEGTGGAVLSGVGPRSTPLRAAVEAASERVYDKLRRDRGMAYAPYADYMVVGAGQAHVAVGSDCSDDDAPAVLEELWATARELAEGGATEDEIERYRRKALRALEQDDAIRGALESRAADDLLGGEPLDEEVFREELAGLTAEQTAEAFRDVLGTALLLGPDGAKAPGSGFCPATPRPRPAVEGGDAYVAVEGGSESLRVDDRGATYHGPDGEAATIEWERCAAAERRPDGSLMLHAHDGAWLVIAPAHWRRGDEILERVVAALDPALVIPAADADVAEAVEKLAAERLEEPQRVGDPLATLSQVLKPGEEALDAVEGVVEGERGVLALTDQRVLWLVGTGGREMPLGEIRVVKLPRVKLLSGPIELASEDARMHVDVRPMARAREIAAEIERRAG